MAGEETPLKPKTMAELPLPKFTYAIQSGGRRLPQAIAHRGYKAAYPENTMGAFRGAVEVGAHGIETDLHITRDGVVVLSHDPTLKRCFGIKKKIIDCDWEYIKTLETLRGPKQHMPRLKDLLEYLAAPGLEDIWVLLDIKVDNNKVQVFKLISEVIAEVKPSPSRAWNERILLGCWAADQLNCAIEYLPEYPYAYIGWNVGYARKFLKVPNVSFNMFQKVLVGPLGRTFIQEVKAAGRSIFLWTVNDEQWMRWSIKKEVDGVITDDPKKFLAICKTYNGESLNLTLFHYLSIMLYSTFAAIFTVIFDLRHGFNIDTRHLGTQIEDARVRRSLS